MSIDHETNQRNRIGELLRGEKPFFKSSAVLIPLVYEDNQWKLIVTQRSAGIPFSGEIAFPGGKLEKGETPEQAALREAYEEINLDPRKVTLLDSLGISVAHFNKRKTITKTYTMKIVEDGKIKDHRFEVAEPKVYAIKPVIGVLNDDSALKDLKPNTDETTRILKLPLAPLIEAVQSHETGANNGSMLTQIDKDDIQQYLFTVPDPERAGHTVEIRHISAGMLRDFLSQFKNERELSEYMLMQPMHKLDKDPSWKTKIITNNHPDNNNGRQV